MGGIIEKEKQDEKSWNETCTWIHNTQESIFGLSTIILQTKEEEKIIMKEIDKVASAIVLINDVNLHQLSAATVAYARLRIQNRSFDNNNIATSGNTIIFGSRQEPSYELASGDDVELLDISPCEIWCQEIGVVGYVVIGWLGYGRMIS